MIDTANGSKPVMVTNVVILYVPHKVLHYIEDVLGANGVDWLLQGTGTADVFSGGQHYKGTWDMTHIDQPLKLLDATGKPMKLPTGLTWFHVVDPGTPVSSS